MAILVRLLVRLLLDIPKVLLHKPTSVTSALALKVRPGGKSISPHRDADINLQKRNPRSLKVRLSTVQSSRPCRTGPHPTPRTLEPSMPERSLCSHNRHRSKRRLPTHTSNPCIIVPNLPTIIPKN
jgi:hypothetical protein